jgi:hypothetical protein
MPLGPGWGGVEQMKERGTVHGGVSGRRGGLLCGRQLDAIRSMGWRSAAGSRRRMHGPLGGGVSVTLQGP